MCNANLKIMDLLDWNNSEIDQIRGRENARSISDLSIFMQPMTERFNKNVWENCALIICEKADKELEPYLMNLLEWTRDLNWPGAMLIFNGLRSFRDHSCVLSIRDICIDQAKINHDEVWLTNLMMIAK